ncbi:hypothetical protein NIES267_73650 (plasmid) [Calothrix parasitica NIES-267]|uniref:Uncharacterized protein n=1 Tax=Calothrix parasitica NIES-267 TaxID=1973488 RepID=A0A1Z4M372_9CYAN|nr:hypothetical protein NIES267_73650 [Calothrix parasitica NIES-267]
MDKLSIALNRNNQSLSNADFKKGVDTKFLLPVPNIYKRLNRDIANTRLRNAQRKKQERAKELKQIKQDYEWKQKKTLNLNISYAILLGKTKEIDLFFTFDKQAFLEVITETFDRVELEALDDIIYRLHDDLNDKLNKIKSGDNLNLYYQYHTFDKTCETITADYNGEEKVEYGGYVPNNELIELENESDLYLDLHHEIEKLINWDIECLRPVAKIKQALTLTV